MSVVHPLRLRYSNAYLVVGERPLLVDTGSRGDAARIAAGCAAAGVAIRDLALILHTHVHSDHFGNTADLATEAGCPVAYHPGDRPLAMRGNNGPLRGVGLRGRCLAPLLANLPFRTGPPTSTPQAACGSTRSASRPPCSPRRGTRPDRSRSFSTRAMRSSVT